MAKPHDATSRSLNEMLAGVPQRVCESRTIRGDRGLFTAGMLVLALRPGEDAATVAAQHGFQFIGGDRG